jgi:outer membrane lipopolysaccharide assembly protein LptE/RlpB
VAGRWWLVAGGWRLVAGRVLLGCAVLASASCGYALAGHGSSLPASIKTIGVPTFVNSTSVFNIETMLTEKVRREFIGRGKYQVLPQSTGVDAVLNGTISSITASPLSFSSNQLASRYNITMTARIELRDAKGTVLWENPALVFRQEYEASSASSATDATAFFGHEINALDRLSEEFARAIVSAILEAF